MKIIKWQLYTGFANCMHEGEIEVEDTATDEEIDNYVREEAFQYIEWNWTHANPSR
jgi:hypothetical protein